MKNLKFLVAAAVMAAFTFSAVPTIAQGPGGGRMGGGRGGQRPDPVANLTKALNLTPGQQTKIKGIFDGFRSQMQGMRGDPNARQKMQGMLQSMEASINKVLTPHQQNQLKAMGGLRGVMGGGPGGRMQRNLDQLGLTASQKAKIGAIMKEMRAKMEAIPEDQRRTQGRALMDSYRARIEAVLTPEQKAKFEQMSQQGRRGGGGPGGGAARAGGA